MKYSVILIAIFSTFFSFSQKNDPSLRSGQMHSYNPILSSNINKFLSSKKNVKGSRFVFTEFKKTGKIYMNGKSYVSHNLNIDALNKDLVLKIGNDSILILEKREVDSLIIGSHSFKKINDDSFYEVLYNKNDNLLLKEYGCYIKKGRTNVMKGTTENDSYKLTKKYYLYQNGTFSNSFDLNKKIIPHLFKEKRNQLMKYKKTNNLDLKKENDVVKLLSYYYQIN